MTTIWFTFPYADKGVEKIDVEIGNDSLTTRIHGATTIYYYYPENFLWHRTKKAAIAQAKKFRRERIAKAAAELARILALPTLC